MNSEVPHDIGYVLGNGPSRDRSKTRYDGVTYGCNSIHTEMDVDVLVVIDAWYQFEVIASGYPIDHKCLFGDWNPMPVGVKPEDLNPPNYDLHEYNPEDRKYADNWCYYATSAADYEKAVNENYVMPYWKPDCGYVCWVGENYKIKEVNFGVIPIGDLRPPSGAYALQEALKSGHDRVEVFGFDSIAGVFSTTSTIAFKDHDLTNDIIEEWDETALHVPFRAGQRDRIAYKNVYGVGLSAGFLEPLEATNIAFTILAIENLGELLSKVGFVYNDEDMGYRISKIFSGHVDEITNFIYMHYRMATKNDTLFWKEIKEKPIPDQVLPMYNKVIDEPISEKEFLERVIKDKPLPIFAAHHWWQLLKGCGKYENLKKSYSDDFIKYSKLALGVHSNRMDNVLQTFPNHYDFLTEWYEN